MTKRIALALAVVLAVGGCSGQTASASVPATPTSVQDAPPRSGAPTPVVTPTLEPSATPEPTATGTGVAQRGQVVFSTSTVSGTPTNCNVNDQVTAVSAGVPVYATYIFTSTQGSNSVSVVITKNGLTFRQPVTLPTTSTQGSDCFADPTDLSQLPNWGPGVYHFITVSGESIISAGDLAVLALP